MPEDLDNLPWLKEPSILSSVHGLKLSVIGLCSKIMKSKSSSDRLEIIKIKVLEWSRQSPDLNAVVGTEKRQYVLEDLPTVFIKA